MNSFSILLSLNLFSKIVLQMEDANIYINGVTKENHEIKGEIFDFFNIGVEHLTKKVFYSLHKLIYHSNFMGKLPSIFTEAK